MANRLALRDLAGTLRSRCDNYREGLLIDILQGVVTKTPVDTGRARGSWQVVPAGDTYQVDRVSTDPIREGIRIIGDTVWGSTVTIVSRLPYIYRLEYGWSQQAPDGMVRLTLQEVLG